MGCQDVQRPERPENLLPKETMVQMLAESYAGNAARSIRNRTLRDAGVELDSILYAKYKVDSTTFAQSNTYYASQVNDYIEIMTQVERIIKKRRDRLDSIIEIEAQTQRDSLNQKQVGSKQAVDTTESPQLIEPAKD